MIETIGWASGMLLAVCAIPQAFLSIKQGHSEGMSPYLLWMWLIGEILLVSYILLKHGLDWPLLINPVANSVVSGIITKYKHWPRNSQDS